MAVEKIMVAEYFFHPYFIFIKFTPLIRKNVVGTSLNEFFTPLNNVNLVAFLFSRCESE